MNLSFEEIVQSYSISEVQQKVYQLIAQINNYAVEIQHAIDTNFSILNYNFYPLRELRIAIYHAASDIEEQSGEIQALQNRMQHYYSVFSEAQQSVIDVINRKIEARKYFVFRDFCDLVQAPQTSVMQLVVDCGDYFLCCEDAALLARNKAALLNIIKANTADSQLLQTIGVAKHIADHLQLLSAAKALQSEYDIQVRFNALEAYEPGQLVGADLFFINTVSVINPIGAAFCEHYNTATRIISADEHFLASLRIPLSNAAATLESEISDFVYEFNTQIVTQYADFALPLNIDTSADCQQRWSVGKLRDCVDGILREKVTLFLQEKIRESVYVYAQYLIRNMHSEYSFDTRTMQLYMDVGVSPDEVSRFQYYKEQVSVEINQLCSQFAKQHIDTAHIYAKIGDVFATDIRDCLRDCMQPDLFLDFYTAILLHYVFGRQPTSYVERVVDGIIAQSSDLRIQAVRLCQLILDFHCKISHTPILQVCEHVSRFLASENMKLEDFLMEHRYDARAVYKCTTAAKDSETEAFDIQKAHSPAPNLRFQIYAIFERIIQNFIDRADFREAEAPMVLAVLLLFILSISIVHVQRQSLALTETIVAFLRARDVPQCELSEVVRCFYYLLT